jgi:hypothetical protein
VSTTNNFPDISMGKDPSVYPKGPFCGYIYHGVFPDRLQRLLYKLGRKNWGGKIPR